MSRTKRLQVLLLVVVLLTGLTVSYATRGTSAKSSSGRAAVKQSAFKLARMSDEVSIQTAGPGNPHINLSDGHELITGYLGEDRLTNALLTNQARPLSLATDDFDEDGVQDLIAGYEAPDGEGIVVLHRGNVDAIYPNSPEAQQRRASGTLTDAPFLSPALVYSAPAGVDLVGAGDFDGDGHRDVAAAKRGANRLYLLSGDGRGGLAPTRTVALQSGVTAMVVGEINRRDGLDDLIVAVHGETGAKALVFEGPEGAFKTNPEEFPLPAKATALALGQLDDEYTYDLAIAAGHELVVINGRDRKLSLNAEHRATVKAADVIKHSFAFEVYSIAIGDYQEGVEQEVALLCGDGKLRVLSREGEGAKINDQLSGLLGPPAPQTIFRKLLKPEVTNSFRRSSKKQARTWKEAVMAEGHWRATTRLTSVRVSSAPLDNLLIHDRQAQRMEIVAGSMPVKSANPYPEGPVTISINAEAQPMAALPMRLNGDGLSDLVFLNSNNSSPIVSKTSAQATFTVTTNADNGSNFSPIPNSLREAIIRANNTAGADEIRFDIPASGVPTIRPAAPLPFITTTIFINGSSQPGGKVEMDGTNAGATTDGLYVTSAAANCVINNLIINRFNGDGITLDGGNNRIEGCFLGTDVTGTVALKNGFNQEFGFGNIVVFSSNNVIGGTTEQARNVSSATDRGIVIWNNSRENRVLGNYLGTDSTGTRGLGVTSYGVILAFGAKNSRIGEGTPSSRNIISGANGTGVFIQNPGTDGNLIQGNFIGTDPTGNMALGNRGAGVAFIQTGPKNNTIGGTSAAAANVISGQITGILCQNNASPDVPNAELNLIQGNLIGTNASGTGAIPNTTEGIHIRFFANNIIGGDIAGARNVISGNGKNGVKIDIDPGGNIGSDVVIRGNYIGTDITGNLPIGNKECGILIDVKNFRHTIENNRIAFNGSAGVCIPDRTALCDQSNDAAFQVKISSNLIFSNAGPGIDLGGDGITENDFQDLDCGANTRQNYPVIGQQIQLARLTADNDITPNATVTLPVTFNSTPDTEFIIQFWFGTATDATGHQLIGENPILVGQPVRVRTNANGDGAFDFSFVLPENKTSGWVNCLAINDSPTSRLNTSELSRCVFVEALNSANILITSATKNGKRLTVTGTGFVEGAQMFLNGSKQKKVTVNSDAEVVSKKAGNNVISGVNRVKIVNSDGGESNEFEFRWP